MECCDKSQRSQRPQEVIDISPSLTRNDKWKHIKLRFGIARYSSHVVPGIYRLGNPTPSSPLLVSANYLLSFDILRSSLKEIDAWILVINTSGINVWCAAGKGSFGTEEVLAKMEEFNVSSLTDHKKIILPQLAAPGTSAFKISKTTGFKVIYGPVLARDLPEFLENNCKATPKMRKILFPMRERTILVPIEIANYLRYFILLAIFFLTVAGLTAGSTGLFNSFLAGLPILGALSIGLISGCALVPIFLPYIPFRSFVIKGHILGTLLIAIYLLLLDNPDPYFILGNMFLIPTISGFLALNFTGCSTYTSQSGVEKEFKMFTIPMIIFALSGTILLTLNLSGIL